MKAVLFSRMVLGAPALLVLGTLALSACSPNRELDTGTPKDPDYCPCDIPPAETPKLNPNLF